MTKPTKSLFYLIAVLIIISLLINAFIKNDQKITFSNGQLFEEECKGGGPLYTLSLSENEIEFFDYCDRENKWTGNKEEFFNALDNYDWKEEDSLLWIGVSDIVIARGDCNRKITQMIHQRAQFNESYVTLASDCETIWHGTDQELLEILPRILLNKNR